MNAVWPASWRAFRAALFQPKMPPRMPLALRCFRMPWSNSQTYMESGPLVEEVNKELVEYVQIIPDMLSHQ